MDKNSTMSTTNPVPVPDPRWISLTGHRTSRDWWIEIGGLRLSLCMRIVDESQWYWWSKALGIDHAHARPLGIPFEQLEAAQFSTIQAARNIARVQRDILIRFVDACWHSA
jgi:hypothetical protein